LSLPRDNRNENREDLDTSRQRIADLLRKAMVNHPPLKDETHKILSELKTIFPELEVLRAQTKFACKNGKITLFWWDMLPVSDLLGTIERRMRKKPFTPERQKEVFAFILWLAYDLLFKNSISQLEARESVSQMNQRPDREIRAEVIISGIKCANAYFRRVAKTAGGLLREDIPLFFVKLPVPCDDVLEDFSLRLQSLASLFEVNLDALRSLVQDDKQEVGMVKLTELWLKQEKAPNYTQVINVWRNIIVLRRMPPTHSDLKPEALDALAFFGQKPPVNYTELWDTILVEFSASLRELQHILADM
jgi:hypothetical protein